MPKINKAFTLIELLIVIAILGVLATFTIINFTGAQDSAKDTKRKSDLRQFQTAIEVYANANDGYYPSSGGAIIDVTTLCGAANPLGDIACQDDSDPAKDYEYHTNAANTSYVLIATLDRPIDATEPYFVLCSNGNAGTSASAGTGGTCPL